MGQNHPFPSTSTATVPAARSWRAILDGALREQALKIVRTIAGSLISLRVESASLGSGAAGLGHLFNRLFQVWGEPRLADRSRFWFARALEMRRPGHGIAGYAAWRPDENDVERWWDHPGIISGAAGIALALLSAATPLEPSWDRMMLVDIPEEQVFA